MDPIQEFRRHAADCRQMAKLTKDSSDKAVWESLAERWERCIEAQSVLAEAAAASRTSKRRFRAKEWSDRASS